jgi:hypothetical protein
VLYDPTAYLDELKAKGTTVQRAARQAEIDAIVAKKSPKKRRRCRSASMPQLKKALAEKQGTKRNQSNNNFKG